LGSAGLDVRAAVRLADRGGEAIGWYEQRLAVASDSEEVAYQIQILMMGAIVSAGRGDRAAARCVRVLAELLLKAS
jgi:hypothetical protein